MPAAPPLSEKTFTYCWAQFTSVSQIVSSGNLDAIVFLRYRLVGICNTSHVCRPGGLRIIAAAAGTARCAADLSFAPALSGNDSHPLFHHDQLVGGDAFQLFV